MNNFKKDGFRKGGSAFAGKPRFGGNFGGNNKFGGGDRGHNHGDRQDREMFRTTCSECRKACEVPFRPTGEKPVYCRECFEGKDSGDTRFSSRNESRGNDFRKDARPHRDERPVRHEDVRTPRDTSSEDIKRQLAKLESKIESIIELLKTHTATNTEAHAPTVKAISEEAPKKERKPKTEKKKAPAKKKVAKKTK